MGIVASDFAVITRRLSTDINKDGRRGNLSLFTKLRRLPHSLCPLAMTSVAMTALL
jgi:hypothetical protein